MNKEMKLIDSTVKPKRYKMSDFWTVCKYSPSELIARDRSTEIRSTRQLGMTWAIMCGHTSIEAGRMFDRNHATALHALKVISYALEIPGSNNTVTGLLERLVYHSYQDSDGSRDSPVIAMMNLEKGLSETRPWIFHPDQFYCLNHAISNRMGDVAKRCQAQCSGCR